MNRKEFCKALQNMRINAGRNSSEFSFDMRILPNSLKRMENGEDNFGIQKAIKYLHLICKYIILSNNNNKYAILNAEQFNSWLSIHRKETHTQRSLSEATGASVSLIAKFEQNKNFPSIDMFLKIVEALGYTVTIEDL